MLTATIVLFLIGYLLGYGAGKTIDRSALIGSAGPAILYSLMLTLILSMSVADVFIIAGCEFSAPELLAYPIAATLWGILVAFL